MCIFAYDAFLPVWKPKKFGFNLQCPMTCDDRSVCIFAFQSTKVEVWFQLECTSEQLASMVTANWHFYVATFFLWYPNLIICYSNM